VENVLVAATLLMVFAPRGLARRHGRGKDHGQLWLATGLGMGIAAFGCGLGQGKMAQPLWKASRESGSGGSIFTPMLLSLAFVETLVLFTFLMILIKVK